jgi:DNA topoisomerase-1
MKQENHLRQNLKISIQKKKPKILNNNIGSTYKVADLETKPTKKSPTGPFTTSTLQQEAARKLYLPVGITMQLAQRLYEAGLITYMRTDSVNLLKMLWKLLRQKLLNGKEFSKPRTFVNKSKGAQEAHEAIPTDMSRHTVNIDRDQARLYDLIWKRTLASQMSDAKLERTNVKIEANNHSEIFTASGEVLLLKVF